jgi:hypothetical protein
MQSDVVEAEARVSIPKGLDEMAWYIYNDGCRGWDLRPYRTTLFFSLRSS